jgi:hypothetical protein
MKSDENRLLRMYPFIVLVMIATFTAWTFVTGPLWIGFFLLGLTFLVLRVSLYAVGSETVQFFASGLWGAAFVEFLFALAFFKYPPVVG